MFGLDISYKLLYFSAIMLIYCFVYIFILITELRLMSDNLLDETIYKR